ncbi:hypothetical protein BGW41_005121 [Actinomortierella wolfii]|nr:hypothetical protein BGW41_005121 [Actinomortierella wolfii]
MPSVRLSSFFLTDRLIASHPQKKNNSSMPNYPLHNDDQQQLSHSNDQQQPSHRKSNCIEHDCESSGVGDLPMSGRPLNNPQHPIPADTMSHEPPSSTSTSPQSMSPSSASASLPKSSASSTLSVPCRSTGASVPGSTTLTCSASSPRTSSDLLSPPLPPLPPHASAAPKHRPKPLQIATRPRDDPQRAISAPLVTAFAMDSLLRSPQLNQQCTLPSG